MVTRIRLVIIIALIGAMTVLGSSVFGKPTQLHWQSLNGPRGGYVTSLLIVSTAPGVSKVFAGTLSGVFVSADHGEHWKYSLPGYVINKVVVDTHKVVYAATQYHGIWVSTDLGKTWLRTEGALTTATINDVVIDQNNVVYVATEAGIYASTDGGKYWYTASSGDLTLTANIKSLTIGGNNTIYAFAMLPTKQKEIFKTTDAGHHWQRLHFPTKKFYATTMLLVDADNNLYASGFLGQIYLHAEQHQGHLWNVIQFPEESWNTKLAMNQQAIFAGFYNGDVFVHANNCQGSSSWNGPFAVGYSIFDLLVEQENTSTAIYAATSNGVYASFDMGQTWIAPQPTVAQPIVNVLASDTSNVYAGLGADGILLSSRSKQNIWHVPQENLMAVTPLLRPIIYGSHIYVTTDNGLYISNDRGGIWQRNSDYLAITNVVVDHAGIVYLVNDAKLYFSSDHGGTWSQAAIEQARCLTSDGEQIYVCGENAAGQDAIWITTDHGKTWHSQALPETNFRIHKLVITINGNLYAAGFSVNSNRTQVYVNKNNDSVWHLLCQSEVNESLEQFLVAANQHDLYMITATKIYFYDGAQCRLIYTAPAEDYIGNVLLDNQTGNLFMFKSLDFKSNASSSGLLISSDHGATWLPVAQFSAKQVNDMIIDAVNGAIYVGTFAAGVYVSHDHGKTWNAENFGLDPLAIGHLTFDNFDNLYAATLGGGLFRIVH